MTKYKNFKYVIDSINKKSPLQKKKLESYISGQPEAFFNDADQFINNYSRYLNSQGLSFDYAIDAYLKMCKDMVKSQIYFMKKNKYPMEDQEQAYEEVYNSKKEMQSYMIGLALSQYLWGTHYAMFRHLTERLKNNSGKINSYFAKLSTPEFNNSLYTNIRGEDINSITLFSNQLEERIQKIKIKFRFHDGTLVDFGNSDINFTIEFGTILSDQEKDMKIRNIYGM